MSIQYRKKNTKKRVVKWAILLVLVVGITVGFKIGDSFFKKKGFNSTLHFLTLTAKNYWYSFSAEPPEQISIKIADEDFQKLAAIRDKALYRGILINEGDDTYVPLKLEYNGEEMKGRIRLKGHMTDHLQEKKWSFRVKLKGKQELMGMQAFSFQHPGTRNYYYEWIYHQLMAQEGVAQMRYKFVNLTVNGEDWGIYAIEEHFDTRLLENNKIPNGAILRYDPELYWYRRINEHHKIRINEEHAHQNSTHISTYRTSTVMEDSLLRTAYFKGAKMLDGFRRGDLSTDQTFDIDKLARFHAVMDLVGGHLSLDWSDVKYLYNGGTHKVEPLAYESTSIQPTHRLAGSYKYREPGSFTPRDLHINMFSNLAFYEKYIQAVERVAEPEYLDEFLATIDEDLRYNLGIIFSEFPYKPWRPELYRKNQMLIRKILNAPKPVQAYYSRISGDTLFLNVASIDALPVELLSLHIEGGEKQECQPVDGRTVVPSKIRPGEFPVYREYGFVMKHQPDIQSDRLLLKVAYPGASKHKYVDVIPLEYDLDKFLETNIYLQETDLDSVPFILHVPEDQHIFLRAGEWELTETLVFPKGYKVEAAPGFDLTLKGSGRIISYSPLLWKGNDEMPIHIRAVEGGQGINVIQPQGRSAFRHVHFEGLAPIREGIHGTDAAITMYETHASFFQCTFKNSSAPVFVEAYRSTLNFNRCLFSEVDTAINVFFTELTGKNSVYEEVKERVVSVGGEQ